MFHFYFNQSIPSITDWIQAIGVFFVAGALLLQWQMSKLQTRQVRLTSSPRISLELLPDEPFFNPDTNDAGIIKIKITNNPVYNLIIRCVDRDDIIFDTAGTLNISEGDNFEKKFSYLRDVGLNYFILEFNYEDIAGFKYQQTFKYWHDRFLPNAIKLL